MIYMSKQRGLCSGLNRFLDPKFQDFFQSLFVSKQASLPPVTVKWAITRGGCLGEVSTIGLGLGNFSVLNRWLIIGQGSKLRLIRSPVRLTFSPWRLKILV